MTRNIISRIFFSSVTCILLLVPHCLYAHGSEGRFWREVRQVAERTDHPEFERIEGSRLFAWRLFLHGLHLMTEDQADDIELAHKYLEMADRADAEGNTPDIVARAARFRDEGQKLLINLLESLPNTNVVRIENGQVQFDPDHVFNLSGDSGTMVFKVIAGGDGTTFATYPYELTAYEMDRVPEYDTFLQVPVSPTGTTWVTYRIKDAPPDKMMTYVDLLNKTTNLLIGKIHVGIESGPLGRLRFRLLDEHGKDTPALVRLTYKDTSAMYRPAGALEAEDMLRDISGEPVPSAARPLPRPGEPFAYWIPGPSGGHYWVNVESFDQALPAGEWTVHIWKGTEYRPMIEEFEIPPNGETNVTYRMERWIDMRERGWWSGDVHVHSRLMSDNDAKRLLLFSRASDLHVANIVRMGNYMRTYFEQRGYGKEFRVQEGNFVLVPGQEDPRGFYGHSLAINIDRPVRDMERYFSTDWVARETQDAGGLYGHAHMTFNGFDIQRDLTIMMPEGLSDFGEILQIGELETTLYHKFLNLGFKLTAAAGSDLPFGHALGEVRHYVYTGEQELNADAWFEAMKHGHTFVSNGPMIDFKVDDAIPGDEIVVTQDRSLNVRATVESLTGKDSYIRRLTILKNGEKIAEKTNKDSDQRSLTIEIDVDAGFGCWIAAEAENASRLKAHTTPVYITRDGFRRWNFEQVPGLLDECDAKLDAMELELVQYIESWEAGVHPKWNYFYKSSAEYAPYEIERISRVRGLYRNLRDTYEREKSLRQEKTDQ